MKLTRRSTLADVAAVVAKTLADAGIRAVLTGGACATLYSKGECQSSDLDFILQSRASRSELDAAMTAIDFRRKGDRFEHPATRFFVEFPPGPLSIGAETKIRPAEYVIKAVSIRLLSPTDSCRDRLAAFYHWDDRQSLDTAVRIARHQKVDIDAIRSWSSKEGASAGFDVFVRALNGRTGPRRAAGERRRSAKPGRRK